MVITDPVGPGLDPDAMSYMGAAESVAERGIYQIPAAKWTSADSTAPLMNVIAPRSNTLRLIEVGERGSSLPSCARRTRTIWRDSGKMPTKFRIVKP